MNVNICGIQETEWENNWCKKCKNTGQMNPSVIIDAKVYSFAKKHNLVNDNIPGSSECMLSKDKLLKYFEKTKKRIPEYLKEYLES